MYVVTLPAWLQPNPKMTASAQKAFACLGLAGIIASIALGVFYRKSNEVTCTVAMLSLVLLTGAKTKIPILIAIPTLAALGALIGVIDAYSGGIPLFTSFD